MKEEFRGDGTFIVYLIQCRWTIKDGRQAPKWFSASFDHFGHPPGFTASDPCWQKLGIHGTFEEDQAFEALRRLSKYNPEHDWRVIRCSITQNTEAVITASARTPGIKVPTTHTYPTAEDQECSRRAGKVIRGK